MKKLLLVLLIFNLFTPQAAAHMINQPPYLKIGGKYTDVYPVYGSTADQVPVPNDIAADTFLVGTPVIFEITTANLPLPPTLAAQISFSWDFGDKTKVSGGESVSHPYTKIGSYVASVYAVLPSDRGTEPELLQSTLIHIVPNKEYALPKAVIAVNGKRIRDPLVDVVHLPLIHPVRFDASSSTASNKIVSYQWDFGDRSFKETVDPKITYAYRLENYTYGLPLAFVVLRIRDANGFIAYTYVQINNTTTSAERTVPSANQGSGAQSSLFLVGIVIGLLLIVPVIFLTLRGRKHS